MNIKSTTIYNNWMNRLVKTKVKERGYTSSQLIQKRVVDYTVSLMLFVCSSPILLYTIYRIKKESKGPILFKQQRIGLGGKPFTCYKFRSMHVNSHFNPYTAENDIRIFPYGLLMRKMRIDELPQLINILKGEMHLVGPRAEWDILVREYEKTIPNYQERYLVRPGITGLAQVLYPYGQNITDARHKLTYDKLYIANWSLWLELKVIYQTVMVVLKRKGV